VYYIPLADYNYRMDIHEAIGCAHLQKRGQV